MVHARRQIDGNGAVRDIGGARGAGSALNSLIRPKPLLLVGFRLRHFTRTPPRLFSVVFCRVLPGSPDRVLHHPVQNPVSRAQALRGRRSRRHRSSNRSNCPNAALILTPARALVNLSHQALHLALDIAVRVGHRRRCRGPRSATGPDELAELALRGSAVQELILRVFCVFDAIYALGQSGVRDIPLPRLCLVLLLGLGPGLDRRLDRRLSRRPG